MFNKLITTLSILFIVIVSSNTSAQNTVTGSIPADFNVVNGTANYSIPIQVAPGRGGMQPELSLNYSSAGGNGIVGVGWSLGGLSAIHRCPASIAQDGFVSGINFDANDRYCLDGQRLIPVNGANGGIGAEYKTEIDGYSKIVSVGGSANNPTYWLVKTKAGQVMTFGGSGNASSTFSQGTSAWAIRTINDTTGNNPITYNYFIDQNTQYLDQIIYAGGQRSVRLTYETKPDINTAWFAGNIKKTTQRLTHVKTFQQATPILSYALAYENIGSSNQSRLIEIKQCDAQAKCLSPIIPSWSNPSMSLGALKHDNISTSSFGDYDVYTELTGDFDGDGLTDMGWVASSSYGLTAYTALGKGDGTFHDIVGGTLVQGPYGSPEVYSELTGDFNGDGLTDIAWAASSSYGLTVYTALGKGDGTFHDIAGGTLVQGPYGSPEVYSELTGDFNGDGLTDVAWAASSSYGLTVYTALGKGDGTFHDIDGGTLVQGPYGSPEVYSELTGDFNGDGLTDVAWAASSSYGLTVYTALGKGDGTFHDITGGTLVQGPYGSPEVYSELPGDFNGDGLTDVAWVASSNYGLTVFTAIGKGDGTFNNVDGGTLAFGAYGDPGDYSEQLGDFNGDGVTDVAWSYSGQVGLTTFIAKGRGDGTFDTALVGGNVYSGYAGDHHEYAELTGDFNGDGVTDVAWSYSGPIGAITYTSLLNAPGQQNTLSTITQGLNQTIIHYKPLIDSTVYTKGTGTQFPIRDLQHPQYVVSRVLTSNGIGGTTTVQYEYEGLKAHVQGRGSYGYSKITEIYPDTGKRKTTHFDQRDFPYTGNVLSVVEEYNGQKVNESVNTMAASQTSTNVYQLNLQQSIQKSYELGNGNSPVTTVTSTNSNIDSYGNIGRVIVATTGNGQTFTKVTDSNYTNDTNNWFLGRLTQSTVTHQSPYSADEVRSSGFSYENASGLLTEESILSTQTGLPVTTTTYGYDSYGQKTSVTVSAQGDISRTSTTTYNTIGQPTQSCNVLNQCETFTYTQEGWLATTTGPNGITTSWQYDGFGRKTREDRADGTWTTIDRHFASSSQCGDLAAFAYTCNVTQTSGTQPATVQLDSLGREVRKIKQSFDDRLVYSDVEYNHLAQVDRVSRDYYVGNHTYWATSEYDALGRITRATEPGPHGSITEIITEYNGLTTTVRSGAEQRSKTTITNAIGQKVRIEEETGTYTDYTYNSDGNLLTTRVADDPQTTITLSYDEYGRKIGMNDPDMGQWSYSYNAFGQLTSQTDAKSQTVTMQYDILDRMISRTEPEGTSNWTYGDNNAPQGSIGKLLQESGNGLTKDYSYDNLGRPTSTTTTIAGQGSFTSQTTYDNLGRVKRVTYPGTQNFYTDNHYNTNGFLAAVTGLRAHAEGHDYSALIPLVNDAVTLVDDYLLKANELRTLGQYYQSQIAFYKSLVGSGPVSTSLQSNLVQHQSQLSGTVAQGQALSPEFMGHLNNTIDELQSVSDLINTQTHNYQTLAGQLVVLAEQTLAAADHSFQIATTLDNAADAYNDIAAEFGTNTITYWKAVDVDASGRISAEVYGNGIVNDYAYNQATGQLQAIHSSLLVFDPIRHLEYQYDEYQNVTLRDDLVNDIRETYTYDRLDRLTASHVTSGLSTMVAELNTTQSLNYDALGNITYKSDVGSYSYGNNAGPHAATQAGANSYSYDANGNMLSGDGRTIGWSSFNKPTQITQNGRSATFSYGPNRARFKKLNHQGDTTLYIGNLYERLSKAGGAVDQKHYIYAAGQLVAEHILSTTDGIQTRYLHKDALGSVDLVTDAHGNVVDRRSFDAWGKLRELPWEINATLNDPLYLTQLPFTNKGYTGHENVQEVNLIHMNGRMYDVTLARFISADPHIQADSLSQSYNRYSYVMNNPLKYTDPSGYFFKKLFKKVKNTYKKFWQNTTGAVFRLLAKSPILNTIANIAACTYGGPIGCAAFAAGSTYAVTGDFGAAFKAGALSYFTAEASTYIKGNFNHVVSKAVAHGVVGGTATVIRGGKFGHGFASSFFTKMVSNPIQGVANSFGSAARFVGAIGAALVGGTASKLGGGKFSNGARTAAIQYLFNQVHKAAKVGNSAANNKHAHLGLIYKGAPNSETAAYGSVEEMKNYLTTVGTTLSVFLGGIGKGIASALTGFATAYYTDDGVGGTGAMLSGASEIVPGTPGLVLRSYGNLATTISTTSTLDSVTEGAKSNSVYDHYGYTYDH